MEKLIDFKDDMFDVHIEKMIWCYGEEIPTLISSLSHKVDFHHGISEELISMDKLGGKATLLVIDDLQSEVDSKLIGALFTKYRY